MQAPVPLPELAEDLEPSVAWRAAGMRFLKEAETVLWSAEGEFDALLLWQEVGDLVGVATLGSCIRGMSAKALRYLLGCPRLLVAYDVDADGEKGAERLGQLSSRMHCIRPPMGKDVTGFWQAGGRVRDWVCFELARLRTTPGGR